jgi:hypothetical protein
VKTIERLGSASGKPAAQVRISDCGVTTPPVQPAAATGSAGSKRPAESSAGNASKKTTAEEKPAAEGIGNSEKNQKKINLPSGLEYVDIKVQLPPPLALTLLLTLLSRWARASWPQAARRSSSDTRVCSRCITFASSSSYIAAPVFFTNARDAERLQGVRPFGEFQFPPGSGRGDQGLGRGLPRHARGRGATSACAESPGLRAAGRGQRHSTQFRLGV